jgi:hypothetical protein
MKLGFYSVAVVGKLVKKNRKKTAVYKRRNNTQNDTKTRNIQNRKHTQNMKTNIKRILKNIIRLPYFPAYKTHRPIRRTMILSLEILEKIMMNVF